MAADPDKMTDPAAVRRLLANAERLENPEVVAACQRRLYELGGQDIEDPVERRLWQAVTAYEETLRQKHGKTQQASYTRRKIAAKGAIVTLSDWAIDPKPTPGFAALVAAGMARFTGEYVVVEFRDRFAPEVVEAAIQKLRALEVVLPE
ncbi:hypothetical protein [Falsirhodobacter xinxiangensis]|uniref:hypothetical protein n=1 Tax=Falsirhodobacter xinxiangensis TaxID=2530049 RepID=UPI0010A99ADE|nr:hypothetical protein [Rhodobacter xinxiangensis]